MVYNVDELVKRLAAGETSDAIAAEMTDMLNAAQKQHRAEEEAKKVAQSKAEEKRQEMTEILTHVVNFLQTYYPDMCADVVGNLNADEKNELFSSALDAVLTALDETASVSKSSFGFRSMDPLAMALMLHSSPFTRKKSKKTEDDILNDFLGKICH